MESNLIGFPFTDVQSFVGLNNDKLNWIFEAPNADEVVHIKSIIMTIDRINIGSMSPNYLYMKFGEVETIMDRFTQAPSNGDTTLSLFVNHCEIYLTEGKSLRIHIFDVAPGDKWYITVTGERNYLSNRVQVPS